MSERDERRDDGQSVLSRLSAEMVRAQKQYFGRGPTEAKSYFLDDMLVVVMRGGLTTAEKSMLEFGEADEVRGFRQTFENRMTERLTGIVEELTGRKVLTYQSQVMFDPDRIVEMFVFDERGPAGAIEATGVGLIEDRPVGLAEGDPESPDPPVSGDRGDEI